MIRALAAFTLALALAVWVGAGMAQEFLVPPAESAPASQPATKPASKPVATASAASERGRKVADAIRTALPEYEQWAAEGEAAIKPLLASADPNVQSAVLSAQIQIEMLRTLKDWLAADKDYKWFGMHVGERHPKQWKEGLDHFVECAKAGRDPFAGAVKGERVLRSPIDGQLLFYRFALPANYDPKKKYPLDVALHAGAGLVWRGTWISGKPSTAPHDANREDAVMISPCGRGNASYGGMGEPAVLDAIADACKHYAIDEDRVFIGGASMGGSGAFHLATLRPDVFACGHSLTGGPNYGLLPNNGRLDAMLRPDNLCNAAFCIWDAPKEGHWTTNHTYSGWLAERAKAHPGYYPSLELTDPNGSHGIIDRKLVDQGNQWVRQQKRNRWPKLVIYKTYGLRYDGAYWAYIDTMPDAAAPARIEAELQDGGKLRVAVENVDRFHLNLAKELVGDAKTLAVTVNGQPAIKAPAGDNASFALADGKWPVSKDRYGEGLFKKHGVSGPVMDVFMGEPVLMVYGTADGKDAAKGDEIANSAAIRLFGPCDGGAVLHTLFNRKADKDVTPEDIAGKHLVLFGTPKQNTLVAKLAEKLPAKFTDSGIELGGKAYTGDGLGLVMVYPNPQNPQRYILLLPENYGGYTGHGHAQTWGFPDYVIGKPQAGYGGVHMAVQAQGSFDSHWQLPKK